MRENVNLKMIAGLSGTSVATVSRVINENGRYSKETGDRVRKVIEEYGYQPNQLAKGLRTSKIDTVGIIVPDITNEFFSALILSMQKRLFRENYSCIIFNTNESREVERRCISNLLALNVSGIVSANGKLALEEGLRHHLPTIHIDRNFEEVPSAEHIVTISADHEDGAYQAGRELAVCGCKRVACITALPDSSATRLRTQGFERACRDFQMELPAELFFVPKEVSLEEGYKIVDEALGREEQFDGIFCQTDWLAIGALTALMDHHIEVPGAVQVIGFDDIRASRVVRYPLTTIHQPSEELGERAAELIMSMINGQAVEAHRIKLPVQLKRRGTTKAPAAENQDAG